jgi:hypothetical protein
MFTQVITTREDHITLEVPQELRGHEIIVTMDDLDIGKNERRQKNLKEALAFWRSQQVDLSNFKFNREEANER